MQNDKEDWVHFTAVVKETAADEKNTFFQNSRSFTYWL